MTMGILSKKSEVRCDDQFMPSPKEMTMGILSKNSEVGFDFTNIHSPRNDNGNFVKKFRRSDLT